MSEESNWTWNEDKQFEDCLPEFGKDHPDRWSAIVARLGTKSAAEVEQHYDVLLKDLHAIEAGLIELPKYTEKEPQTIREPQTTRVKHWSEEEHRYGRGNWKSIANVVKTRTPLQVQGHAKNYFERQEIPDQDRKRKSTFD